jgi:ATP-dependent helicase/nuclease subunit B
MRDGTKKSLSTIPAGIPFARAMAHKLLSDYRTKPEALAHVQIFLPTRRACRVLREAFLKESEGRPLILPKMQPLGDVDEEELSLAIAGTEGAEKFLDLPPGMSTLRRQVLLARLIHARADFAQGFDQALGLAAALGRFIDQVYTENLDLGSIKTLVPAEFAAHWQITLQFLDIIADNWPKILEEQGMIDGADRRNRLILALARHWQSVPPRTPVIVAGSTGSIPAVAELLSVIAGLEHGEVILPGFDIGMDQESWDSLSESHPQFGFRQLLDRVGASRHEVKIWSDYADQTVCKARRVLAREIMRPAQTTTAWTELARSTQDNFNDAFRGLSVITCNNRREEAEVIAITLRGALENPEVTAALITPDRALARQVRAACARWAINVDDSAGQSLDETPTGLFLRLLLDAVRSDLAPVCFLALLKHPFFQDHGRMWDKNVQTLERAIRGPRPPPGFKGLRQRLTGHQRHESEGFLQQLEHALAALLQLRTGSHGFETLFGAHLAAAEALVGAETLWGGADGEAAALLLAELREQAAFMPDMSLQDYGTALHSLFMTVRVRPAWGTHPRLMILGQLEARLVETDFLIMGSLNEGSWPPDPGTDPWMSRPMRRDFGLPAHERSIGLAAHDFVQGFCARDVILTRAARTDGAPTVPARWLQRLGAVLQAAGYPEDLLERTHERQWARLMDDAGTPTPRPRPGPKPPLSARPRSISATRVETWLRDPYAVYARSILALKKLDPLEQDAADAAVRGTLLHDILEQFVTAYPADIPENAAAILQDMAREKLAQHHDDPAAWQFWLPRFEGIAGHYLEHERSWRREARPLATEAEGQIMLHGPAGAFTVTAIADRIDQKDNAAVIIDYKSSATQLTIKGIEKGHLPQLAIEALILSCGGFADLATALPQALQYWVLDGQKKPISTERDIPALIERTKEGLETLIATFDNVETPYYSLPDPARAPRFNDYEHLARVKEWSNLGEDSAGSGEGA